MEDKSFGVLILMVFIGFGNGHGTINATGGGIVPQGSELTINYINPEVWDMCYWFWYKSPDTIADLCIWKQEVNKVTGKPIVTLSNCIPESAEGFLQYNYNNTDTKVCSVYIPKVEDPDNATFAARLDWQMSVQDIDIIAATPITSGKIIIEDKDPQEVPDGNVLEAGELGKVQCLLEGGRPAPFMALNFGKLSRAEVVNSSQVQTPNAAGIYTSLETFYITPTIKDFGVNISCQGAIFNRDNQTIFPTYQVPSVTLNVTFAPAELPKQTFNATSEKNLIISFQFEANPPPTGLVWSIVSPPVNQYPDGIPEDDDSDQENRDEDLGQTTTTTEGPVQNPVITISPGNDQDRFALSDVFQLDPITFKINMSVFNVTMEDKQRSYQIEVNNSIGTTFYDFKLHVEEETNPGGGDDGNTDTISNVTDSPDNSTTTTSAPDNNSTTTTTEPPNLNQKSSVGTVFAVMAVTIIIVMVLGSIFIFKKRRSDHLSMDLVQQSRLSDE